jgi:hypothetical protein
VGWIPVLIQYYGFGLLLSGFLWIGITATVGGGSMATWKCISASIKVALLVGITYRANREVVRCFNATPGSKLYRDNVRQAGGGRDSQRLLLEAALGAGLMDEVPDRSTVPIAREYPFWYDATYSRFFFAAHAGKPLETVPPTVGPGRPGAQTYRGRDVLVGREAGYVILSRVGNGDDARERGVPIVRTPPLHPPSRSFPRGNRPDGPRHGSRRVGGR